MIRLASNVRWTSGNPAIYLTYDYEKQRDGADMLYRLQITVSAISSASSFGYPIYGKVLINGSTVETKTIKNASPSRWSNALVWVTGWHRVNNKTSGSTPVSINIYSGSGSTRNQTNSYSLLIDPAASSISAPSLVLGSASTISLIRYSDDFIDDVSWSCGSHSGSIASGTTETEFTFTPPLSLASESTTSAFVIVSFSVTTYRGTEVIATATTTAEALLPDTIKPTVNAISVEDLNGYFDVYGKYIQGKSLPNITVDASGIYGSAITSYKIVCDGRTFTSEGNEIEFDSVLTGSGNVNATVTVADSRGRESEPFTATLMTLPYGLPELSNVSAYRCLQDGTASEEGTFVKIDFDALVYALDGLNTASYKIGVSAIDAEEYTDTVITRYNNVYEVTDGYGIVSAAAASAWDVKITVSDKTNSTSQQFSIPIAYALMNFNASGQGIGFGRISQMDALEFDMDEKHYRTVDFTEAEVIGLPEPADYVIEEGTSGVWRYRKWASGIGECWAYISRNSSGITEFTATTPFGLVDPAVTVSGGAESITSSWVAYTNYTSQNIVDIYLNGNNSTTRLHWVRVHCIGVIKT